MRTKAFLFLLWLVGVTRIEAQIPEDFVLGGIPTTNGLVTNLNITVITNVAYVVGYDETRKDPVWVAYKLVKKKPAYKLSRPDIGYPMDDQTVSKVPANAYSDSPKDALAGNKRWDHGHMAANDAIAKVFGKAAQLATFKMSNMCPQSHRLNGGKWKVLEGREYKYRAMHLIPLLPFLGVECRRPSRRRAPDLKPTPVRQAVETAVRENRRFAG